MQRGIAASLLGAARTPDGVPPLPALSDRRDAAGRPHPCAQHSRLDRRNTLYGSRSRRGRRTNRRTGRHQCRYSVAACRRHAVPVRPRRAALVRRDDRPDRANPPSPARRTDDPPRRLRHRTDAGRHLLVLVLPHGLSARCDSRKRHGGRRRPRTEPYPPPSLRRADRHGVRQGPALVESFRPDRRTASGRSRGVRSRP